VKKLNLKELSPGRPGPARVETPPGAQLFKSLNNFIDIRERNR